MTDDLDSYLDTLVAEGVAAAKRSTLPRAPAVDGPTVDDLRAAAQRLEGRSDDFGVSMHDAAVDMAAKLARFGRYASAKQADFARRICEQYSMPRQSRQDAPQEGLERSPRPKTWAALQGFSKVTVGTLGFSKKNGEELWWITYDDALVGLIDATGAKGFDKKIREAGLRPAAIKDALDAFEADPVRAITEHGLRTGHCGCCGRELTDQESIARGIGPICAEKLGGGF